MEYERRVAHRTVAESGDTAVLLIRDELISQVADPPGGRMYEPATSALCAAILQQPSDGIMGIVIHDAVSAHARIPHGDLSEDDLHRLQTRISQSEIVGIIRSTIITYCYAVDPDFSDAERSRSDDMMEPLQDFLRSYAGQTDTPAKQIAGQQAHQHITQKASTAVFERQKPPELILQSAAERLPASGARMLEIGGSIGMSQFLLNKLVPMRFQQVTAGRVKSPLDLSVAANNLLQNPSVVRECVSVDIDAVANPKTQQYKPGIVERAYGSLRPSERHDARTKRIFRLLQTMHDPDFHFLQADITTPEGFDRLQQSHPGQFDFIQATTMTYELKQEQRQQLFQNMLKLLAPNGLALIVDFAGLRHSSYRGPVAFPNYQIFRTWHDKLFKYRAYLIDGSELQPSIGLQEVMRLDDSRCAVAKVMGGRLAINGELRPITDLIAHANKRALTSAD